ncbi:MAG TPA: HAMP domain-containing sensor histidine kinase [Bacteroidota bacterium]|nr:HAMP domain-containing sensor histidine kinase [Bacteroidota bacterium]
MTIAIGGILFLQYRLLKNNVELKEESFGRNALAALNAAAERVEEVDVRDRLFTAVADSTGPFMKRFNKHDSLPEGEPPDTMIFVAVMTSEKGTLSARLQGTRLSYRINSPQDVSIRIFDELGRLDTTLLNERKEIGGYELILPKESLGKGVRFIRITADSATSTIRWEAGKGYMYRFEGDEEARAARIIGRVAETVTAGRGPALSERLRPELVDSAIAEGLAANGITLPYQFAVRDVERDSLVVARMDSGAVPPERTYSALLFPAGFSERPGELLLWFPGYRSYLVQSILPELLLNLLFVLIIGACFRYAIRTLRKQREFAGRLSDFINNMTHEFKTPLSTIALSTEALARPDVVEDRSKVEMYGSIIADEQKRMKSQVDRILEMAALEEGEFEFKYEMLDLHEIAGRAAANSALRVKEKGGTVTIDLWGAPHTIRGDAVHIENVVNSVLDNAEKYSPDPPEVRVSTYNADGWIVLSVADRGIGIASEHLPNIFEKYYRVPTDNLHDVKGFGIGLSYVRLVVERHGGIVRAASVPGAGTTIEMKFRPHDGG